MAIIAKDDFTQGQLYYSVGSFTVHPRKKTVSVRLNAFQSADASAAFNNAEIVIPTNEQAVKDKTAQRIALYDAFMAKTDKDKVSGLAAFKDGTAMLDRDMESLRAEIAAQKAIRDANQPSVQYGKDVHSQPGDIAIPETGAIDLPMIYTWLSAGPMAGAVKA